MTDTRLDADATDDTVATDARVLRSITATLLSTVDRDALFARCADTCLDLVGVERVAILDLSPTVKSDATDVDRALRVAATRSVANWPAGRLSSQNALHVWDHPALARALTGDVVHVSRTPNDQVQTHDLGAPSAAYRVLAPILSDERPMGLLDLGGRGARTFSPERIERVRELAELIGLAITRGDAFARERKMATRLGAVGRYLADLARVLDVDPLLDRAVRLVADGFGFGLVSVFLRDPIQDDLVLQAVAGWPIQHLVGVERVPRGMGIIGAAFVSGARYHLRDVRKDPQYIPGPRPDAGYAPTQSEVAFPISARGEVVGVLDVQSPIPDAFDDADLTALEALAAGLSVAVENARLFREVRADGARVQALLDAVPSPVAVYDAAWRVEYVNQPMREVHNVDPDSVGKPLSETLRQLDPRVIHLLDNAPVGDVLQAYTDPSVEIELHLGEPKRILVRRVRPVPDRNGRGIAHIILYQDVTIEREALLGKDRLISIIAHELRTPLTALIGFAELLDLHIQSDTVDMDGVRRRVTIVRREARRLNQMIEQLLGLSRLESDTFRLTIEPVMVNELLRRVVDRFGLFPGSDRLVLIPTDEPLEAQLDEGRVDQILTNLIDNALKHAPGSTPIVVTANVVRRPPRIPGPFHQELSGNDRWLHITIRDEGPGLALEDQERLFQPYVRGASRDRGGLGLGLHVSRLIAQRHGGTLALESAVDVGTTAHVVLPLTPR